MVLVFNLDDGIFLMNYNRVKLSCITLQVHTIRFIYTCTVLHILFLLVTIFSTLQYRQGHREKLDTSQKIIFK